MLLVFVLSRRQPPAGSFRPAIGQIGVFRGDKQLYKMLQFFCDELHFRGIKKAAGPSAAVGIQDHLNNRA